MKTPNLREFQPDSSQAKNVEDTPMLNTTAKETVDMNESNVVGQELVVSDSQASSGTLGAVGRN